MTVDSRSHGWLDTWKGLGQPEDTAIDISVGKGMMIFVTHSVSGRVDDAPYSDDLRIKAPVIWSDLSKYNGTGFPIVRSRWALMRADWMTIGWLLDTLEDHFIALKLDRRTPFRDRRHWWRWEKNPPPPPLFTFSSKFYLLLINCIKSHLIHNKSFIKGLKISHLKK